MHASGFGVIFNIFWSFLTKISDFLTPKISQKPPKTPPMDIQTKKLTLQQKFPKFKIPEHIDENGHFKTLDDHKPAKSHSDV